MKEIFNNPAFTIYFGISKYHKKHFWLFSQTQRTKRFLFVSETLSLKVEFVLQSAPFSVPHTFFHSVQCRASSTSISFFSHFLSLFF